MIRACRLAMNQELIDACPFREKRLPGGCGAAKKTPFMEAKGKSARFSPAFCRNAKSRSNPQKQMPVDQPVEPRTDAGSIRFTDSRFLLITPLLVVGDADSMWKPAIRRHSFNLAWESNQ